MTELTNDLQAIFSFSKDYTFQNKYLTLIIVTILVEILWLTISYLIYYKTDKNLNLNSSKYDFKSICIELTAPVIANIFFYWFSVITINIIPIVIYTIFWMRLFLKFIGQHDKDVKTNINKYLHQIK